LCGTVHEYSATSGLFRGLRKHCLRLVVVAGEEEKEEKQEEGHGGEELGERREERGERSPCGTK